MRIDRRSGFRLREPLRERRLRRELPLRQWVLLAGPAARGFAPEGRCLRRAGRAEPGGVGDDRGSKYGTGGRGFVAPSRAGEEVAMAALRTILRSRREFLVRGAGLFFAVPLADCASSARPIACDGDASISTVNSGHSHTLCVPSTDLASPPVGGFTYTSSAAGANQHTHDVTLSQIQLAQIAAGQLVTVTSAESLGHTHDFTIQAM
jgi:hypothetical protein